MHIPAAGSGWLTDPRITDIADQDPALDGRQFMAALTCNLSQGAQAPDQDQDQDEQCHPATGTNCQLAETGSQGPNAQTDLPAQKPTKQPSRQGRPRVPGCSA